MENQIQTFGRPEMAALSSEIQSALDIIKEKFGLAELSIGSISFSLFSFTGKITGTVPEHRLFAESYAIGEAKYFAVQNGLPEDILDKKFVSNGKNHTVIRIETRNPKYPIITYCEEDRKNYKFSVQIVKEILARI
jgi:hypothetical protein